MQEPTKEPTRRAGWAVVRVETEHYGRVLSKHRSHDAAQIARRKHVKSLRRTNQEVGSRFVYVAWVKGTKGDRVRYA